MPRGNERHSPRGTSLSQNYELKFWPLLEKDFVNSVTTVYSELRSGKPVYSMGFARTLSGLGWEERTRQKGTLRETSRKRPISRYWMIFIKNNRWRPIDSFCTFKSSLVIGRPHLVRSST
jgi:hypothetical protein